MDKILKNLIGPSKGSSAAAAATTENGTEQQPSPTKSSGRVDDDPDVRMEEKLRQKAFAHYDVQSLTAKTVHAASLCAVLAKRRNTTTGASAASQSKNPDEGHDAGDSRSNDMVQSCPYFRNELGGEEERVVALCRETGHSGALNQANLPFLHRPSLACGLSLLEDANERRWRLKSCPYQRLTNEKSFIIENLDIGATYYREHFYGLEHQNWFGVDEAVGPIAISIRKERIGAAVGESSSESNQIKYQYRVILRTSDLSVLRGTVYEGCVPGLSHSSSRHNHHLNHHAKEVLEYLVPDISLSCLRLGVLNADEQLLKLDEQVLTRTYKVGVLFCRDGQGTEEEMYNNEHASPALDEFLTLLGDRVRLKGFPKYRAGLDSKTDTTGTHSVYTCFNDCEVMFHVSTLLPYTPNNKQQLLRKRHIGNDIVTIIFQEPHAKPFTPKTIRSHFQHVFILVRQIAGSSPTKYSVAVSRSKEVPVFGPPIEDGGVYTKSKAFSEFLLSKVINAENAAHRSDKFRSMAQRTRFEYLKDLANNYISHTTLSDVSIGTSAGAKLVSSIFGASRKSRSNRGSHFVGDAVVRGAIMWELSVQDYGQPKVCDCTLAISGDTFLLLEEAGKELIFVIPNSAILGWTSHSTHIRIYYHQGESLLLYSKDPDVDEISEIVVRLRAVTSGCETQEMILRRNSQGQLGFHVTNEGIVTDVESYAFAWQVGLRQNFRIVEICKVAIATLDLDQVTDLLKTSMAVSVTVLPPNPDNSPRRGCNLTNCSYLTSLANGCGEGDYENISGLMERTALLGSSRRKRGPVYGQRSMFGQPGSKSTPVSPDHESVSPPRGPLRKHSTLKASPTSAFSALTPAVSLSEFNDNANRLMSGAAVHSHHYYSHHSKQFGSGSNLIKTRSEMSLTNPSPPPGSYSCAYPAGRRYPSPSRSHSQHFGKVYKPSPMFLPGVLRPVQAPPKPKAPGPGSGYYSDSSSVHDVWSLPVFPNPASQPNPVLAVRNGRPAAPSTTSSSSAFHSLERKDSQFSRTGLGRDAPPYTPSTTSASSYAAHTKSPRSVFPSAARSASDRLRIKSGSTKSSNSSCNGSSSSTLQEDLLKLISPEYRAAESHEVSSSSGADTASTTQYSTPYSSLERPKVNGDSDNGGGEEIVTIAAHPAHVVPSTLTDAPALTRAPVPKPPRACVPHTLPDGEIDWPSLVDTATRAMARSKELGRETDPKVLEESLAFFSEFSAGTKSPDSVRQLEQTVEKLQNDLVREQEANSRLKEENQRLQEESQTAAAQLRKFTQWFFANVNAK